MHQSARSVATKQCALWSAQHLHPLDIEQAEAGDEILTDVHIIDINCDRRLLGRGKVVLGYAADTESVDYPAAGAGHLDIGGMRDDVDRVGKTQFAKLIASKRRNGNADVLKILFTLLGGYHHLLQNLRD